MNEDEVQQRRRQQDEASTEQRSRILGLKYLDMRPIEETLPLARDLMTIEEMHNLYMLPLTDGNEQESYQFAVTTQTPQSVIQRTRRTYQDQGLPVEFYLISLSAYRVLMNRFDPPKKKSREAHGQQKAEGGDEIARGGEARQDGVGRGACGVKKTEKLRELRGKGRHGTDNFGEARCRRPQARLRKARRCCYQARL